MQLKKKARRDLNSSSNNFSSRNNDNISKDSTNVFLKLGAVILVKASERYWLWRSRFAWMLFASRSQWIWRWLLQRISSFNCTNRAWDSFARTRSRSNISSSNANSSRSNNIISSSNNNFSNNIIVSYNEFSEFPANPHFWWSTLIRARKTKHVSSKISVLMSFWLLRPYGSIEFKKKSWEEQAKPEGHENADLAGWSYVVIFRQSAEI